MNEMNEILKLKTVLDQTGVSIKELSNRVDMTYGYIGAVVRHEKYPTLKTIKDIAHALDVDVRDLFVPTKVQGVKTDAQLLDEISALVQELKDRSLE